MLLEWGVQFALSTARPTANRHTALAHTHPQDKQDYQGSGLAADDSFPRQCFLQTKHKGEQWDRNTPAAVLSAKGCICKPTHAGTGLELHLNFTAHTQGICRLALLQACIISCPSEKQNTLAD